MKIYLLGFCLLIFMFTGCSDAPPKNTSEAAPKNATGSSALPASGAANAVMQCVIDGKIFKGKGFYNSFLFYPNGFERSIPKGSLTLAFKAAEGDDNLQLMMTVVPFDKKTGAKPSNIVEALYSGTIRGQSALFGYKQTYKNASFSLEITKVEDNGAKLIISGKFAGKLTAVQGQESQAISIENGEFSNAVVNVVQ